MVLVDTSVWIEFFRKKPSISVDPLHILIEEKQVVTCLPITAEILSGEIPASKRSVIQDAFNAMVFIDLDWNSKKIWEEITHFALTAKKQGMGIPGLIDRMILLAAQKGSCSLWTLDRKLQQLAKFTKVPLFTFAHL